ncbi:MAG: hypothetical protein WC789_10500 [Lentisphaeria bacterium]
MLLNHWHLRVNLRHPPSLAGIWSADGHEIVTSPIATIAGRSVTTASGSVYTLGQCAEWYPDWLAAEGFAYTDADPVPAGVATMRTRRTT